MARCSRAALLAAGLHLEPLVHPKPGAVTRIEPHSDKDVYSFVLHASLVTPILVETCLTALDGCGARPLRAGLSLYISRVARRLRTNIALGSFILLLPLAAASAAEPGDRVNHALEATRIALRCTGVEEARLYLEILSLLRPSHLGRYEGPLPDATRPGEAEISFPDLLAGTDWDIVHSEIVGGYPRTLEAADSIERGLREGLGLEDAVLWAILRGLAEWGDTLIYQKYGGRAYLQSMAEAGQALEIARREGARRAIEWLDSLWRPRGWNPGAVLDVTATALGLLAYHNVVYQYVS